MSSKEVGILKHAAENGFNVLLEGHHGVGKTAMVKEVFDTLGWNWKYFSASTIDPHTDLVGIPFKGDSGQMELLRPANIDFENLEAIFLDEYNRAPKKVRNAVMELIQFGSINGKRFPNLKVVWAAINPDEDDDFSYDVERLDEAQRDRFHIWLPVPNNPCPFFFKKNYGSTGTLAVKWWQAQTNEIKQIISPRRLEAGVRVFLSKGDPQYVFDATKVNIAEFSEYLDKPDPIEILDTHADKPDAEKRKLLANVNTLNHVYRDLVGKERYLKAYAHILPESDVMKELRDQRGNKMIGHVVANVDRFEHLIPVVLNNAKNYSPRVVEAFRSYQQSSGNKKKVTPRDVTINGKKHKVTSLCFCFTGKMVGFKRDEVKELVRAYGAKATDDVTFETTHLVSASRSGVKVKRAERQNVEILTEEQFYDVVRSLEGSVPLVANGSFLG